MKIRFGAFVLDSESRQLTSDGGEIRLSPKALELLLALVLERPRILSRAVLQERLGPGTPAADLHLPNLVAEIRQALGDHARHPLFVRTSHGLGYAFCGEATVVPAGKDTGDDPASCWLEWGIHRFPLSEGEHVVGRDPKADVRLDHSTVSRRHALIVVRADGIVLEDCDSKNGTFRGNDRVTSRVPLADGDTVRFGSVLVMIRVRSQGSAETHLEVTQ